MARPSRPAAPTIVCILLANLLACAQQPASAPAAGARTPAQDEAPPRRATAEKLEADLRARLGTPSKALDLDLLMLGEDFSGAQPRRVRWDPAGGRLWFDWKRAGEHERGTWSYDLGTRKLERMPEGFEPPVDGVLTKDRGLRAYTRGDALLLQTTRDGATRELARIRGGFSGLVFSADEQALLYRQGDGIHRVDLGGRIRQLLFIDKKGTGRKARRKKREKEEREKAEKQKKKPTLEGWHEAQELDLFRRLHEQKERRERRRKVAEARDDAQPRAAEWIVPEGWSVGSVTIAPSGTHAAVQLSKGKSGKATVIPRYVNEKGYTRADPGRTKVGDRRRERRLEIVDLATGEGVRVAEPVEKAGAAPMAAQWSPDGKHLYCLARTDDDRRVFLLEAGLLDGKVEVLHEVEDEAWTRTFPRLTFLKDGSRAFFLSEKTGWQQLYLFDPESREVRQLTRGRFEVSSPQADPRGRYVYAVATPTSPHVRDLVRIELESGEMTILTADGGGRSFTLSPDGHWVAEVFSRGNRPWELQLRPTEGEPAALPVTDSPSAAFKSYERWADPEIVWFTASDGVKVPARLYRPERAAPGKPAVVFVHGAGYLQNVHHWWSSYSREYCFHNLLRDEGYTVMDVDYRGSAGYGRDWRCAIYGHMGGRDLDDQVDAARWLVEHEGVAKDRIGIYGGSYGGFITLMALFTKPGVFAAGAALRPVTDWAHYNDGYTSNILDDPLESPQHYRASSPINFAEGLRDHLLICHGQLDFNVHAQDVVRLQQRLIELHKKNWEVATYPLEGHGFRDPASWSDEYGRIKALFDRVLKR